MQELYNWAVEQFNSIPKAILVLTAIVTFLIRMKNQFSRSKEKSDLKQEIEILELLKRNSMETSEVEASIQKKLTQIFESESKLWSFFAGLFFTVFFGVWSMSIYEENGGFTPGMGWTIFGALIGISVIFSDETKKKQKDVFLKIELTDKSNLGITLFLFFLTLIIASLIFMRDQAVGFWLVFDLIFMIIALKSIVDSIKISKK